MVNPYEPQNPATPDYFGGREDILAVVKERIEKAAVQRQSGGVLVYGYRGVGKTSLLKKIISVVGAENNRNAITIYRRISKPTSDIELYQIITETVLEEIDVRKNALEKIGENVRSARFLNIEFKFDEGNWMKKTPYFKWTSLVQNVKNASFILIAIDDADYLSKEALGELKTIVENQNNTPILLVVSGGIEFEERLVEDYSPIARVFSGASFNLTEFDIQETTEVLNKPIAGSSASWAEEAIKEVQEISRGYPYLVQCIASASYVENNKITAERVKETLKTALEIGKPWLNHELTKASDQDITSFLKIIKTNKPLLKSSDMQNSGVSPPYIRRLVKLRVIKKISRGRYILQKPPIIAYYHALKRGITVD